MKVSERVESDHFPVEICFEGGRKKEKDKGEQTKKKEVRLTLRLPENSMQLITYHYGTGH